MDQQYLGEAEAGGACSAFPCKSTQEKENSYFTLAQVGPT